MNQKETEAWMLGYQEGYDTGYDDGRKKKLEEAYEKMKVNKHPGPVEVDFLKVTCNCGCIIPYPIFKNRSVRDFTMPKNEIRKCPECGQVVDEIDFALAYTDYVGNHIRK